ncbi:CBS domain-containing protein [Natronobacterium gregoryi]|uniref:CBS domain-containing protein n=2 Tax=Natronobacterium gregoryi TaxID=44930 RepID=L0AEN0_NATGS|nr:CBS domain-containing protein [Natronobacterium gregoryi]AFZ71889.1 putative signal-transduction protein containing cAMP-binding and CBS domains [Natronobacterium gregoryi SP2]ELY62490.1 signal transduction protein [Natronobacterium gregoryi SP2]PLK20675.1 CBS domain-containing protein [Natronobacterium gregoryi SP2]SFJ14732.1 CBS domain-containing protein [Natronobacterium gregoryi]
MCARVTDVMTENVVTCERDTSLAPAAKRMVEEEVGSVVVTNDGTPYGIVTESDVVYASYRADRPITKIPTRKVASHPLETVEPTAPVRLVVDRMREEQIKKLVVVEDLTLRGIVTTWDLVDHYGELTGEVKTIRQRRQRRADEWTGL